MAVTVQQFETMGRRLFSIIKAKIQAPQAAEVTMNNSADKEIDHTASNHEHTTRQHLIHSDQTRPDQHFLMVMHSSAMFCHFLIPKNVRLAKMDL